MIDSSISHSNPADVISSGVLQMAIDLPSNRSPPCWSTQMTHPFDRCSFYVFPFAPPFFPLSQFPQRQLVIVENRCEILLPTKSSLLRSFSGFFSFFFLSNLKSKILFSKVRTLQVFTKVLFPFLFFFFFLTLNF